MICIHGIVDVEIVEIHLNTLIVIQSLNAQNAGAMI
nr:MAG TPA: hypothetical protein [Caudoviricetes sp.]